MKRLGFTITEMLVSMALIMFIMVILSEAFVAGLESFRQLKALGDMENSLRTAATILRRDLKANHFVGGNSTPRLSNLDPSAPGNDNLGGFFAILPTPNWIIPAVTTTDVTGMQPAPPAVKSKKVDVAPSAFATSSPQKGQPVLLSGGSGKSEMINVAGDYSPGTSPILLDSEITVAGHTQVQWAIPPNPEGSFSGVAPLDADGLPSWGVGATGYALHFAVDLSGLTLSGGATSSHRRENFFAANLSAAMGATGSLAAVGTASQTLLQSTIAPNFMQPTALPAQFGGQPPFMDSANYYTPYAEVAYFLRDTGQVTPIAAPGSQAADPSYNQPTQLFNLYRRQLAVLGPNDSDKMNASASFPQPNATTIPQANIGPITSLSDLSIANQYYSGFSWIPVADSATSPPKYFMHFNSMRDLATPSNRSLSYGILNNGNTVNPLSFWTTVPTFSGTVAEDPNHMPILTSRGEPSSLKGADLLLTNVIDMTVRVRTTRSDIGMNPDFAPAPFYDSAYQSLYGSFIQAIEVTLRVWDQKTQRTRQLTIVQNL